jgi:hypothetical protein
VLTAASTLHPMASARWPCDRNPESSYLMFEAMCLDLTACPNVQCEAIRRAGWQEVLPRDEAWLQVGQGSLSSREPSSLLRKEGVEHSVAFKSLT